MCECKLTCLKDWQGVKLWIYLPHKAAKIEYESEANSHKKALFNKESIAWSNTVPQIHQETLEEGMGNGNYNISKIQG